MMRMIALPIALALAAPLSAQGFTAPNDLNVAALSGDRFEVIESSGIGATGLWCAAGAYAHSALQAPDNAQLYVVSARAESQAATGRKAVTYALNPEDTAPRPAVILLMSTYTPGSFLSVGHARTLCSYARSPGGR